MPEDDSSDDEVVMPRTLDVLSIVSFGASKGFVSGGVYAVGVRMRFVCGGDDDDKDDDDDRDDDRDDNRDDDGNDVRDDDRDDYRDDGNA
eukprot:1639677-Rhodomonas_salina.10